VVALAVGLFGVNVVARLVTRLAFNGNTAAADRASMVMFAVIGVVLAVVVFVRARREPVDRWVLEVSGAAMLAMLLTVFIGPFISGSGPFASGAGAFFSQIWLYSGFAIGGTLVGYLLVTALGWDYRSQSLKRYAERGLSKPRRVVRR
jgi:FtsH-binding integral membrane protein